MSGEFQVVIGEYGLVAGRWPTAGDAPSVPAGVRLYRLSGYGMQSAERYLQQVLSREGHG